MTIPIGIAKASSWVQLRLLDLLQKYFYDSVYVNSCPLFPVPCSLFPTSARSLLSSSAIN
ncbi:MAG: hypothetical protein F6J94_14320 [Moorea sp. SIO1F2]|uniref:hypothetical protein n=1 Tax=unclassified Moorena TaxID=2683338 RepID=UPI0013B77721|nr:MULTISPECIES: hypothetical protein [unclassified Moorena]NEO00591.1 hypothetical protein [Moorena sp. SIO3I7]NEO06198.1 hypothetical protein [Moorena sp. SIO3I8]NEO20355.1 hypothetical protein [Moorena sp. SIO4A5]NET83058.1 hypothetical protein [Moorena sp. SIO1F2]